MPAAQMGEHLVADALLSRHLRAQPQVFPRDRRLLRNRHEQAPIGRAVGLLGLLSPSIITPARRSVLSTIGIKISMPRTISQRDSLAWIPAASGSGICATVPCCSSQASQEPAVGKSRAIATFDEDASSES